MSKKRILITGTSRGIGESLAKHYLAEGFYVLGCSRSKSSIKDKNYSHFLVNVSNEEAVTKFLFEIKKQNELPDILINNAGVASMNHIILTPTNTVKKIFDVNFLGTFIMSREVAKAMIRKKWGRIINFSTIAVPLRLEGEAIYTSSKVAIEAFTQILAKELAHYSITCNCVGPAPIKTDLLKSLPEEKINGLIQKLVIKKLGKFEDIAHVIDFFIDEKSDSITGQTIYLGGV